MLLFNYDIEDFNENLDNMIRLTSILAENKVPFEMYEWQGGYQLRFSWADGDVISTKWSYNLCESYNFPWDLDDITRTTPERMAEYIVNYFHSLNN
jgi:hypothetical protein